MGYWVLIFQSIPDSLEPSVNSLSSCPSWLNDILGYFVEFWLSKG